MDKYENNDDFYRVSAGDGDSGIAEAAGENVYAFAGEAAAEENRAAAGKTAAEEAQAAAGEAAVEENRAAAGEAAAEEAQTAAGKAAAEENRAAAGEAAAEEAQAAAGKAAAEEAQAAAGKAAAEENRTAAGEAGAREALAAEDVMNASWRNYRNDRYHYEPFRPTINSGAGMADSYGDSKTYGTDSGFGGDPVRNYSAGMGSGSDSVRSYSAGMGSGGDLSGRAVAGNDYSYGSGNQTAGGGNGGGGSHGGRGLKMKDGDGKKGSFWKTLMKTMAVALVFGLVAGGTFAGVNRMVPAKQDTTAATESISGKNTAATTNSIPAQVNVTTVDYTGVVENALPSVVAITGTYTQQGMFGQTYSGEGAGSGFILEIKDDKILIGTNNHVVDGGSNIKVMFNDESTAAATVVGTDKDADLAVLSVQRSDVSNETLGAIKAVTFSDEEVRVGQSVIAIGNALGYGQSVTTGVISAKNRKVTFTDGSMTLLQTDAAINPGNSGGILINTSGEVVGINNSKLEDTSVEGMCYAIPASRAVAVLEELKNSETISADEQAYLGIRGQTVNSSVSESYNIPEGVYISGIVENSPAAEAGLEVGDVITVFDGVEVSTMEGLSGRIAKKKAGTKVTLTVKRKNGSEYTDQEVTVTLGKKSEVSSSTQNNQGQDSQNSQNSGNGQYPGSGNGGNGQYPGSGNGNGGNGQYPGSGNDGYGNGGSDYNWEDIIPYIYGY